MGALVVDHHMTAVSKGKRKGRY